MRPFITGVVLAVLLLVAAFATPAFLRSDQARVAALEDAELARRQLHSYDAMLPALALASDPQGVDKLQSAVSANKKLLDDAAKAAREASSAGDGVVGAAHVEGLVKLAETRSRLIEARRLRRDMEANATRVRDLALEWSEARGQKEHNEALTGAKPIETLKADLADIESQLGEADKFSVGLSEAVKTAESKLAQIKTGLEAARSEMLTAQEQGFHAGDDSSFNSYRDRVNQVSARLVELQEQEHLLTSGGLMGAAPPADVMEGEFDGGQPVLGLEELKRQDMILQDRVARLKGARETLQNRIKLIESMAGSAKKTAERQSGRQSELKTAIDEGLAKLAELNTQAMEREDQALKSARDAVNAFRKSKSAIDGWLRDVRDLQQAKDPQRLNERLKRILDDKVLETLAPSAEAEASALLGRIQAERLASVTMYLATLDRMAQLAQVSAPTEDLTKTRDTAREEGLTALNAAREGYERLAKRESATSWITEGSLATVYYLLSQIDVGNREQFLAAAIESIRKATDKREASPYARELVLLRNILLGESAAPPPADSGAAPEAAPAAEEEKPAEAKPEEPG